MGEAQAYLSIHPVTTPATGNCQAYSVVQALGNSSYGNHPEQLAESTVAIKRGCMARAYIDFAAKYPHGTQKPTLMRLW